MTRRVGTYSKQVSSLTQAVDSQTLVLLAQSNNQLLFTLTTCHFLCTR